MAEVGKVLDGGFHQRRQQTLVRTAAGAARASGVGGDCRSRVRSISRSPGVWLELNPNVDGRVGR